MIKKLSTIFLLLAFLISNSFAAQTSYSIKFSNQVNLLLKQINPSLMMIDLAYLTDPQNFPDRASNHQSGVKAAEWIQNKLKQLTMQYHRDDIQIYLVKTEGFDPFKKRSFNEPQPSVVVKVGNSTDAGIVIGAHFDTQACLDEGCKQDSKGPLPGANDDGSGTVVLLEVARTIFASGMQFKHPIYLIWYAAEEKGGWGSQAVVEHFIKNNISVSAITQLDQVGFAYQNDLTMYLETGPAVDEYLTVYLQQLITTYVKRPAIMGCFGGSDEWSWKYKGFITARPLETKYCESSTHYKYAHKKTDTIDKLNLTHMTDFLKLSLAFAVELAEPIIPRSKI